MRKTNFHPHHGLDPQGAGGASPFPGALGFVLNSHGKLLVSPLSEGQALKPLVVSPPLALPTRPGGAPPASWPGCEPLPRRAMPAHWLISAPALPYP